MERRVQKQARRIAAVFILLLASLLLGDRLFLLWMGTSSADWPKAVGVVQSFEASPVDAGRAGETWRVKIEYVYEVDGSVFQAERVRFTKRFAGLDQDALELVRSRYAPGTEVIVHHHPARHSLAVLEPGRDTQAWFGLLVGLGLVLIAAVFWLVPTRTAGSRVAGGSSRNA
ncbi:MAG: DUF3592 domain-containing protein [Wenzhouxiangella sp.]|nr:DUF3592 domain-containing protein [Wenzhouxiangella sp.]MCH8477875.1 DUF3592 domain-containing protein [Wenzhouxiangella sp.]